MELEVNPEAPSAGNKEPVLVYDASTSAGTMTLQLLRLSGVQTIATCSPKSFELVRSSGAHSVFDYSEPTSLATIKKQTNGSLQNMVDCITDPDSVAFCFSALSRFGGRYTGRRAVKVKFPIAYEIFREDIKLERVYERPASRENREAAVEWFGMFQVLLDQGKLLDHPVKLFSSGGLERIVEG